MLNKRKTLETFFVYKVSVVIFAVEKLTPHARKNNRQSR